MGIFYKIEDQEKFSVYKFRAKRIVIATIVTIVINILSVLLLPETIYVLIIFFTIFLVGFDLRRFWIIWYRALEEKKRNNKQVFVKKTNTGKDYYIEK